MAAAGVSRARAFYETLGFRALFFALLFFAAFRLAGFFAFLRLLAMSMSSLLCRLIKPHLLDKSLVSHEITPF